MFTQIKMAIYAGVAGLIALFAALFIKRGKTIDTQKETIERQEQKYDAMEQYNKQKDAAQSFEYQNAVSAEKAKQDEKVDSISDGTYTI